MSGTGTVTARRTVPLWLAACLDGALVLVFAAIGRASHDEHHPVVGVLGTAWPFLVGAGVGWLVARQLRRDPATVAGGVPVWIAAVAVGMVLRVVTGSGTAVAFVVVATVVLGVFLLGWRSLILVNRR